MGRIRPCGPSSNWPTDSATFSALVLPPVHTFQPHVVNGVECVRLESDLGSARAVGQGQNDPRVVVYLVAPDDYPTGTFHQPFVYPFVPSEGSNEGSPNRT